MGIDVRSGRLYTSLTVFNNIIHTYHNSADFGLYINVVDHTTNSLGSFNNFLAFRVGDNNCATVVSSGNREIFIPLGYMQYGGIDYVVTITTGQVADTCTTALGKYYIFKSDYVTLTRKLIAANSVNNGVQAFVNPTTLGLGLPAFSGYSKIVDVSFHSVGSVPKVLALVFYENV